MCFSPLNVTVALASTKSIIYEKRSVIIKACQVVFCSSDANATVNMNVNGKSECFSPKAGAEPEEEEEAIALSEAGQEGEDQVDGEDVYQTPSPPHLITQTTPHQGPHHHGYIHQQTCKHTHKPKPYLETFELTCYMHTDETHSAGSTDAQLCIQI